VKRLFMLLVAAALGGCAAVPAAGTSGSNHDDLADTLNPADPWENWNRKVFAFNDAIDGAVLKPVAEGYQAVVPQLARTGVDNVLGNIGDVGSTLNQMLQGKVQNGLEMGMRVLVNTVFGLGGVLDPATEVRLTRRSEDFGQTLGRWGVGSGPFVVLPLLGPSSLRDAAAVPVDFLYAPSALAHTSAGSYSIMALTVVNTRSNLLSTTQLLDSAALDRYSFVRDIWLQRRLDQVHDGARSVDTVEGESAAAEEKLEKSK
jgi:phospholipid-binding lipoprotein MlaA